VVGHLIELGVRDGQGRLVDGDALRQLLATERAAGVRYKLRFPYAAVRGALVRSEAVWRQMRQLFADEEHLDEVWLHLGDQDAVSYVNPEGGGVSVLSR